MIDSILPHDFSNHHVLIFGGTTGINLAIAQAFNLRNASVVVVSRQPDNVEAAVASMSSGAPTLGLVVDIRDNAGVERAVAHAVERFGPIHVLIQGAAGNFLALERDLSANGFKAVVDIDLNGTFHVMRQAYPHLLKPGASVINISAPQSFVPMKYQVHACAAKAGVDQITRVLALDAEQRRCGGADRSAGAAWPARHKGRRCESRAVPLFSLRESHFRRGHSV